MGISGCFFICVQSLKFLVVMTKGRASSVTEEIAFFLSNFPIST